VSRALATATSSFLVLDRSAASEIVARDEHVPIAEVEEVTAIADADRWRLVGSGPEAYERYLVPAIFAPFAEHLLELASPDPGSRVLDVACGTGIVARRAAARLAGTGGTVVGVDANREMLDVATAASAGPDPPIRWLAADAADLPLPGDSVDFVLCQQGLQFFADAPAALLEMRRVLVPGGCLALSVWRSLDANPGFAVLVGALERHAGATAGAIMRAPFAGVAGEPLRALVAGAGLRDVRIHIRIDAVRFASAKELLQREAAASPLAEPLGALTAEAYETLARDLTSALRPHTDDHGVVFPMQTYVVTARCDGAPR
jgi:SAM-dependent methyltransferase